MLLSNPNLQKYVDNISCLCSFSRLFNPTTGIYLDYKAQEKFFIESFNAMDITKKNDFFDAIIEQDGQRIGYGLKTFVQTPQCATHKIGHFQAYVKEVTKLYTKKQYKKLIEFIADKYNERIFQAIEKYDIQITKMHILTRSEDKLYFREEMLCPIFSSEYENTLLKRNTLYFGDYSFEVSTCTLRKTFDMSQNNCFLIQDITVHEQPLELMKEILQSKSAVKRG
jgi:hypothetical protein